MGRIDRRDTERVADGMCERRQARRKRSGRLLKMVLLTSVLLLALCMSAQAASRKGWVRTRNRCYYYVNGKTVKGLQVIGGKTYYFSSKGIQRTSWRKIGGDYYYFRAAKLEGGYQLSNMTKNGIVLGKDGKAVLDSKRAKRKVNVMVRVSSLLDKIMDKQTKNLTKNQKLRACYDYLRKHYPYRLVSHFREKDPDFDLWSVEQLFKRGYADCVPYACTFAYIANALGYHDITIRSWYTHKPRMTGHSWVQIKKKYYDVSLGRHNKRSFKLFGISIAKYKKMFPKYKIKNSRRLDVL